MSDIVTINTNGLDEAIRCAICVNSIKTDTGCDGNCRYDKSTFEKIKEAVNGCIVERPHGEWIRSLLKTLVDNGCITAIQANRILKESEAE